MEAIQFDGTEAALLALIAMPRAAPAARVGAVELSTACGRRIARPGTWIARDTTTHSIRLYDDARFQALHEALC